MTAHRQFAPNGASRPAVGARGGLSDTTPPTGPQCLVWRAAIGAVAASVIVVTLLSAQLLVSLGVLGDEPGIVSFATESYELFAITEEAAPRVVTSQNRPAAAGSIA